MRRWLLSQETELFRFRYLDSLKRDREDFFVYYNNEFNFERKEMNDPELEEVRKAESSTQKSLTFISLLQISEEISEFYRTYRNVEAVSFYKVPFLSALDLVQTRQVVIKGVSSLAHLTCTYTMSCIWYIDLVPVYAGLCIHADQQFVDRVSFV